MTVLYGLNGAGKSRIIADVRHFFDGVLSDTVALVHLPSQHPTIDWNRETGRGDWFPDWARRAGMTDGEHGEILRAWVTASLSAEPVGIPGIPTGSAVRGVDRLEALVKEWLRDPLVLVKAVGSSRRPGWASAPAFRTAQDLPATNDEIELYERYDELDLSTYDGLGEIALTPYGRDGSGRTIACASHYGQSALEDDAIPFSAGIHDRLLDVSPTIQPASVDVHDRTRAHLAQSVTDPVDAVNGTAEPSEALVERVRRLTMIANRHFGDVLLDAPALRLHVDPVGLGPQVRWFVDDDDPWEDPDDRRSATAVSADRLHARTLEGLSTAQRRWAEWSVDMALTELSSPPRDAPGLGTHSMYLLDEPEAALHRSAESHMAKYFTRMAADPAHHLLIATHSPELLETDQARVYEVRRDRDGWRSLRALDAAGRENMEALGLQPADLLRRQRGLILVEGLHDEIVLEVLFGEEMQRRRVDTLPIRGASELSPAKISFLFDYTPAHLFVMLDNVQTDDLIDAWERAMTYYDEGKISDAQGAIASAPSLSTDEGRRLKKVLTEVLLNDHAPRMTPFGLSRGDIVEYLPVGSLVDGTDLSWSQLRDRYVEYRRTHSKSKLEFKRWLELNHHADFGPEALRGALAKVDAMHPDLRRLWKTVEARVMALTPDVV